MNVRELAAELDKVDNQEIVVAVLDKNDFLPREIIKIEWEMADEEGVTDTVWLIVDEM